MSDQRIIFKSVPHDGYTESFMITMLYSSGKQYREGVGYKRPETTWDEVEGEIRRQFMEQSNRSSVPPLPRIVVLSKSKEIIRQMDIGF